jgi:flagellar L-ring protein precursor FlgH
MNAATRLRAIWLSLLPLLPLLATTGCAPFYPVVDVQGPTTVMPHPTPVVPPTNGGIYQAAAVHPLFEDYRARRVGETLTVQIAEKVSASQKSTSSIDKNSSLTGSITAIPGVNQAKILGRAALEGSAGNTFAGKGATENTNDFNGTVTVTVRQVLPNGHLLVAGEKQIGVNANVDVLRFSGQVDPRAIQPGNTVPSAQIANVRLEHRGRGAQADAQAVGWLQRAFLSVVSPL